jgi:hypothetical protein
MSPKDMVVLDNLSAHKATGMQQALAHRHVRLRCMSTLKTAMGAAKARTCEAFGTAIRKATETVTAEDA